MGWILLLVWLIGCFVRVWMTRVMCNDTMDRLKGEGKTDG